MMPPPALLAFASLVVVATACTEIRGQSLRFDDSSHLFRPTAVERKAGLPAWSWPDKKAFAARFEGYLKEARPWKVLHAKVRLYAAVNQYKWTGEAYLRAGQDKGAWRIFPIVVHDRQGGSLSSFPVLSDPKWHLKSGAWDGKQPLQFAAEDGSKLDLTVLSLENGPHLPVDLWANWVLVATLVDADAPEKDPALPTGQCSMDDRPARAAVRFSEHAMREGRTGRFLRFRIRVMGDQFSRFIASSYGQAVMGTRPGGLQAAPIDLDRLFLGLTVSVASQRTPSTMYMDPFRLGRAIAEARRAGALVPRLRRLVTDPGLDAWNRTRALAVLVYTLAHEPGRKPLSRHTSMTRPLKQVIAEEGLRKLPMPKVAGAFLDLL